MVKKKEGAPDTAPDYGMVRVFVYGSLKTKGANNCVLRNSGGNFLGYDSISVQGAAFMDLDAFPALIYPITGSNSENQLVRGEIWYGSTEILKSCDILEGHPLFFRREKHWTTIHRRRVWVYALSEKWISEGKDFMEETMWLPDPLETEFWAKHKKVNA